MFESFLQAMAEKAAQGAMKATIKRNNGSFVLEYGDTQGLYVHTWQLSSTEVDTFLGMYVDACVAKAQAQA